MFFEKLLNDDEITNIYKEIYNKENDEKYWAHHGLEHVKNVSFMMKSLLSSLKYDDEFIDEAMVAGILHDTGCTLGKDGHALRGYEFAKDYIERKNLNLKNKEMILDAIKVHSDGFDTGNIIALALILSDKLDITKERVAKEGYKVEGMRQYQYIESIDVKIENSTLIVSFKCSEGLNLKEMEEYYFTKKVFKAIYAFSNKLNLKSEVYLNGSKWNLI